MDFGILLTNIEHAAAETTLVINFFANVGLLFVYFPCTLVQTSFIIIITIIGK